MSVIITAIISILLAWIYGPAMFTYTVAAIWLAIGIMELVAIRKYGTTVSHLFWIWSKTAKKSHVWIAALTLTGVGIFLTLHLIYGI